MHDIQLLARHRIEQQAHLRPRRGIRRSARLIAQEIRASRQHAGR